MSSEARAVGSEDTKACPIGEISPLRRTADGIAAFFDMSPVDFDALTPFEADLLMFWNRLELRLERAGGAL